MNGNDADQGSAETVRLPETVEEFQRARRAAFEKGARWQWQYHAVVTDEWRLEAARSAYPIRKKVPRVVEVQRSAIRFFARVSEKHNGVSFYLDRECREPFNVLGLHAHEPAIYADLIANPYTYEEE